MDSSSVAVPWILALPRLCKGNQVRLHKARTHVSSAAVGHGVRGHGANAALRGDTVAKVHHRQA